MADINIDFGLLQTPNMLGNYLQGRQYRQQEQQNMLAQQRQQRLDARDAEEFGLKKQEFALRQDEAKRKASQEVSAEQLQNTQKVSKLLRQRLAEGRDPQAAWAEAAAMMPTLGLDPNGAEALRQPFLANPKAVLDAVDSSVEQKWQFLQNDTGIYAGNQANGQLEMRARQPGKPIEMDPTKNYYVPDAGQGGPMPTAPQGASSSGFGAHIGPLLKREGGYNASDGHSGNPVNFGINQGANPDINVRDLTPEKAAQIYKQRYWDAIGGDQLPPEAQGAVFDAAVNQGVGAAQQMWQQSGGDVQKFNQLRLQRYRQTPGYDRYGKAWEARVAETGGGVPMQGGSGGDTLAPPPGYRQIQAAQPKPVERWVDLPGGGQRNTVTGETKNVPQPKGSGRLPATAINLQKDSLDLIQGATQINANLTRYEDQISKGTLNLNPINNVLSAGANMVGASTPASRNYASFKSGLEKLRNDSLRLNKGVQTEGDAQRAWNELIANINDEGVVRQRLAEIKKLNEQAASYHADVVAQLREDSGLPPIDVSRFRVKPPASQSTQTPAARAPSAAVDYLRQNNTPQMRRAFDAKYGQGASSRVLGGR